VSYVSKYCRWRVVPTNLTTDGVTSLRDQIKSFVAKLRDAGVQSAKVLAKIVMLPSPTQYEFVIEEKTWSLNPANMTDTDLDNFDSEIAQVIANHQGFGVKEMYFEVSAT